MFIRDRFPPRPRQREGVGRGSDGQGRGRARRKRGQTEPANMGKHIQHPRVLGQTGGKGVVRALVKEQAGFLPAGHIGQIGRAVHRHRDRRADRARQNQRFFVQPLQPCLLYTSRCV